MTQWYLFAAGAALALAATGAVFWWPRETVTNYPSAGTDLVAFGDSLVYGTGSSGGGFVRRLEDALGRPIVNLGVPGDTTADGVARLAELDKFRPQVVLVLLGGNDYLRQVPRADTFANLSAIIEHIHAQGSMVLLLGVRGGLLQDHFYEEFQALADRYHTAYVPDVLDGLLGDESLMADRVHPNDAGYRRIAERIAPVLMELVR